MKTLEQQLSDYGEMIRADERRLHAWDLNTERRLATTGGRSGGVWVAITTAVGVLLFVGSLLLLTSEEDPATTTVPTVPSTTTPVTTPTTVPDSPPESGVPLADRLLNGILAMQLSTPARIQSIQPGTTWRAYQVPSDLLIASYEVVVGGRRLAFYEFTSEAVASAFLANDPACEDRTEDACVAPAPDGFQAGEQQFTLRQNIRSSCPFALVSRTDAFVVLVREVVCVDDEGRRLWEEGASIPQVLSDAVLRHENDVSLADLLARTLLNGATSGVPERINVVNGPELNTFPFEVQLLVSWDAGAPWGEQQVLTDIPSEEVCEIRSPAWSDNGFIGKLGECWQLPITVDEFFLIEILDDYKASPTLGNIEQLADGTWEATATQWEYELDHLWASAVGFLFNSPVRPLAPRASKLQLS